MAPGLDSGNLVSLALLASKHGGGHLVAGVGADPAESARAAWARAEVAREKWQGHPTHAIRKRVRTHLEGCLLGTGPGKLREASASNERIRLADRAIDHQMGHSRNGVGARNYIDPFVYLPALRSAMEAIPTPEALVRRSADARI